MLIAFRKSAGMPSVNALSQLAFYLPFISIATSLQVP